MANDDKPTTTAKIDPFLCKPGQAHAWSYLGEKSQLYQCTLCAVRTSKVDLKRATDA